MEALINAAEGVRLRRVEVATWQSPAAVDNGIRALPTLWLYDGRSRVETDARAVIERLVARTRD